MKTKRQSHHISNIFLCQIQFVLRRVQSLLLTASHWFLFLRILRRFNSPRSPIFRSALAGLRSNSDISGSKTTCVYPKLTAACHILHRRTKPSHPPNSVFCWNYRTFVLIFLTKYNQHRFTQLPMFGFIKMNTWYAFRSRRNVLYHWNFASRFIPICLCEMSTTVKTRRVLSVSATNRKLDFRSVSYNFLQINCMKILYEYEK